MEQRFTSARQALETLEEIRSETARLQRTVTYLKTKCASVTSRYTTGSRGGGRGSDLWDDLGDEITRLERQQKKLQELEAQILRWIDLLPKPRWRMVLRYRYVDGLDLQGSADEMSRAVGREFSIYQIYRLHRQALASAEALWPLERED